ncbi:sensor histidine kinase [Pseudanabaena yagii]|uniref:histidine kinase n=1 Tax=Pseudanabaena yagii GIHE-NHR1 TaxID=2722753 RepID=A0ABX1LQE6_9CYAN|nr:ATP-binding protein [Pseudanabaena yagii]NMF58339.1 HAMP domain-containing protein [Pseudanabaena yagii GIHE-NHR1]
MKLKSFRFRIAILSALLAGTAIAGFSGITYLLFYQSRLNILDNEIKDQLSRESSSSRPLGHWQTYEKIQASFFGDQTQQTNALLVISDGKTIHQSQNWQTDFNPESLFASLPELSNLPNLQLPSLNQTQSPNNPPLTRRPPPPRPDRESSRGMPENPPAPSFEQPPPEDRPPVAAPQFISSLVTRKTSTGSWRMGTAVSPFVKIAIAVNLKVIDREMSAIQNVFLISMPLTLLLMMLGAWLLSGSALKPIKHLTETIRRVNAKGLNQRTSITDLDTEFVELVQVFNQMMERLERSFLQASRFSSDAAHELKTPLAILQGELELALQNAETGSPMQQTLSTLLNEVSRLSSITRKLLLLSLADAGKMSVQKIELNFSQILYEITEDIGILAPDLSLKLDILPDVKILGDRELLTQVLQNLINNAIKYNLPNGWIHIQTKLKSNSLMVTISNSSQDISSSDRDRLFDRFHRADPARNRGIEGFGLGLSLSREIAIAHNGNLQLDQTNQGCTSFTLILQRNALN